MKTFGIVLYFIGAVLAIGLVFWTMFLEKPISVGNIYIILASASICLFGGFYIKNQS